MRLAELLESHIEAAQRPVEGDVTGLSYDTRKVSAGNVFIALKGTKTDAHDHLDEAIAQGAIALVVDAAWHAAHGATWAVPTFPVPDTRVALARLAARFYGHPSRELAVIGVTGTNGKTTTTHLIEAILQ